MLIAALQKGPPSLRSWEKWRQACPLNDDIDSGFHRLIPLLHHNLAIQAVSDPELLRYAAIRRFYWFRNKVFLREAERMLSFFQEAGIPTLVLKGIGLALTVYPKYELRPICDLDVLVSLNDAPQAVELLKQKGFRLPIQNSAAHLEEFQQLFRSHHAQPFQRPAEPLSIDLHVRLHSPVPSLVLTQCMLADAVPLNIGSARTLIARPADQVFHTIVHGSRSAHTSPSLLRWAADVAMLRTTYDVDIDWKRLKELGRRYECLALLQDALDDVAEIMDKPLPSNALSMFRSARPTARDRLEWTARRVSLFNLKFPFAHMLDYRRFRQADREQGQPTRTFARFLADRWHLQREKDIPHAFLAKILQRLSRLTLTISRYVNPKEPGHIKP